MLEADIADRPDVRELAEQSAAFLQLSSNYRVSSPDAYQEAGAELIAIKAARTRLSDLRFAITRPMDAAKKRVLDLFRVPEERLERAERAIKLAMAAFTTAQETARREEQRRLDEAARRRQEQLRARAQVAEAAGKVEKATALELQAATTVAAVIPAGAPKVSGVQVREVWKFSVENPALLPREYLLPDEQKIRRVVQALKADHKIPGVRVWSEPAIAAATGAPNERTG